MIEDSPKEFLSVKEFANLIHVHYNTVIRAIKNGRLNAFRIGTGKRAVFRIARCEIHRIALMDMEEMVNKIIERKRVK